MISPRSDRAKYRVLANDLKRRIESGDLPAGALLPSETELMDQVGVSRNTAREAIKYLQRQGLVVTEMGRGTSVRERRQATRRWAMSQYLTDADPQGKDTSYAREVRISGDDYTVDREYRVGPASRRLAELLEIPEEAEVLERHFVFRSKGTATQMSVSCYPYELVRGTRVADPRNEPWPGGNIAQLKTLGIKITSVTEQVRSRRPSPEEADTLKVEPDDHVIAIVRRMFAGDRPIEVADIILAADDVEIEYGIEIPQSE